MSSRLAYQRKNKVKSSQSKGQWFEWTTSQNFLGQDIEPHIAFDAFIDVWMDEIDSHMHTVIISVSNTV